MTWARWAAGIERHRGAVILGSLLLSVLSALSLGRLRLDIDVLTMLPRGQPAFDDFKAFVGDFGQLEELLVLIEGPRDRSHRFADALAQRLGALDTVSAVQPRIDMDRVADGLLGQYLFNYIPAEAYPQVAERLTPAGIDAALDADQAMLAAPFDLSLKRRVAADPLGLGRFAAQPLAGSYSGGPALDDGYVVSSDGKALLLFVRPRGSPFDAPFAQRLLADAHAAIAETRSATGAGDLRVELAGSYVFATEDAAVMKRDIIRYTLLAFVGVLAVFYVAYGNLRLLPFIAYPVAVTTLLTFGLSLVIYDQLNVVSLAFAAILYGLSIDTGILFYSRLLQERRGGSDPRAAVTAALAALGRAEVAGSGTTAAAFVAAGLSVLTAVSQLGILTAIGMCLSILEFVTLYPALGFTVARRIDAGRRDLDTPRLGRLAAWSERHRRSLIVTLIAVAAACALEARHVRLDPTLTKLRPADSAATRLQDEIAQRFVRSGAGGAVLVRRPDTEAALTDAERIAARLRGYQSEGLVSTVQSVDALLPSVRVQQQRLERYNALPRAAAGDRLRDGLRARGFRLEPFAPFLDSFAAPRQALLRLGDPDLRPLAFALDHHVRQRDGDTVVTIYVDPTDGEAWPTLAQRLRADLPDVDMRIAARGLLEHELQLVLQHELFLFTILALTSNFILLRLLLGDVRTAFAVLAPVFVVVRALFAGMALCGVAIDPVNLVVTPLLFGIGIDYGVYVVTARRQRGNVEVALRTTGRAICTTALTTIAGFGVLSTSTYPPLASLGALVAIGLTLCLITTVAVLPALLPHEPEIHR